MVKTREELDDELCDYCSLPEELKGVHNYGNGPVMCVGYTCEEAYQNYLEECEEEIELPGITVNKIEESGYRILKDIIVAELVNAPSEPIVRKLLKANDYLEELRKENKKKRWQKPPNLKFN